MSRDLFAEAGIEIQPSTETGQQPSAETGQQPRDLFAESGITMEPEKKGVKGILSDVAKSGPDAILGLSRFIENLPSNIQAGAKYGREHPLGALEQLPIGLGEALSGIASSPHALGEYLGRKGYGFGKSLAKHTYDPYSALMEFEKKHGLLPTEKGQAAIRGLGQLPAYALPGSSAARLATLGAGAAGQGQNPLEAIMGAKLLGAAPKVLGKTYKKGTSYFKESKSANQADKLKDELHNILTEQAQQKASADQSTENIEVAHGSSSVAKLVRDNLQSQESLKSNIIKTIDTPQSDEFNIPEEPKNLSTELEQSKVKLVKNIQDYIFHKKDPGINASKLLTSDFENKVKNEAQNLYKSNESLLADMNIEVPDSLNPDESIKNLQSIINTEGWGTTQAQSLSKKLNALDFTKPIPALKFYQLARDARQTASKTRNAAYGKTAAEFDKLIEKADQLDDQSKQMFDLFSKLNIGPEILGNLNKANDIWAKQVIPVEKNPIYKSMKSKGRIEENSKIIPKLAGTETGLDTINKLINENPQLLRSIFGHDYAKNPEKLLDLNEREQSLLDNLPNLKKLQDLLRKSSSALDEHKQSYPKQLSKHQELTKALTDENKKIRESKQAKEEIKNLDNKIKQKEKAIKELREIKAQKTLTASRKANIEEKIRNLEMENRKHKSRMNKLLKVAGTTILGSKIMSLFLGMH